MTDGLLAFSSACAIVGIIDGGNAIIDAVAAQNLRKLRRDIPWLRSASPSVLSFRDKSFVMCWSPRVIRFYLIQLHRRVHFQAGPVQMSCHRSVI